MRNIDPGIFAPYEDAFRPGVMLSEYAFSLCGGPCAGMIFVDGSVMLLTLVRRCIAENIPYKVLGGMTNILVSDAGFDGVALINRKGQISHSVETDGSILLRVDSGVSMAAVVRYCAEHEISGFEWAAGLPGTVGGAAVGNAGAFGTSVSDIFIRGEAVDQSGAARTLDNDDMAYGYRSSMLKENPESVVLLNAEFRLKSGSGEAIRMLGQQYRKKRQVSQPVGEHSLGSVFKNPPGNSAGKLIQDAGLKGFSVGKAVVSMKHANFFTTEQGVRSADYRELVETVRRKVTETSGIMLEPEIEYFGF